MMRFRAEQRSDGSWVINDTHKGEICFALRSIDQMLAERWAEMFDTAYAAFRDEANSARAAVRISDTPQGDGRRRRPGVETTIPASGAETTRPARAMPSAA
jgi:hypothetical protein